MWKLKFSDGENNLENPVSASVSLPFCTSHQMTDETKGKEEGGSTAGLGKSTNPA